MAGDFTPELNKLLAEINKNMKLAWPEARKETDDAKCFKKLNKVYVNIRQAMVSAWALAVSSGNYTGVAQAAFAALREVDEKDHIRVLSGFKEYIRGVARFEWALRAGIKVLPGNPGAKNIVMHAFVNGDDNEAQQIRNLVALRRWMIDNLHEASGQTLTTQLAHNMEKTLKTHPEARGHSASRASSRSESLEGTTPEPLDAVPPLDYLDEGYLTAEDDEGEVTTNPRLEAALKAEYPVPEQRTKIEHFIYRVLDGVESVRRLVFEDHDSDDEGPTTPRTR